MVIHPVRMNGLIIGVPQSLLYLKKMEERVIEFVTRNSEIDEKRFKERIYEQNIICNSYGKRS